MSGLTFGLVLAVIGAMVMALVLWRRDGVLLVDYAAAAIRYRTARLRGTRQATGDR